MLYRPRAAHARASLVAACSALMVSPIVLSSEQVLSRPPTTCTLGATDLPTDRWARDMQEKDLSDVMSLLALQPVFVDPSGKTFHGRRSIRHLYTHVFAGFDSNIVMTEVSRESQRSSCVQVGSYREDLRTRSSGSVVHITGQFKFTYTLRPDGAWWIARQEWGAR